MKRTLALLLASVLTCSVLLTSLPALETKVSAATNPAAQGAEGGYLYEWTPRGELEKATINFNTNVKDADYSNSLFLLEVTGDDGAVFSPMTKAYSSAFPDGASFSLTTSFDVNGQNVWKNGATVNEDGTIRVSSEYNTKKVRLVFTAPVEGLYTLVPKQIPGKNVTAYAFSSEKLDEYYDNHAIIYTDKETLSEGDILVRAAKETDAFKQDCETCIELKQGEKLYIEFDPTKAESYIRNGKKNPWHEGGIGVISNFSIVLNSFSDKSEVYSKSYGVGSYIKSSIPSKGVKAEKEVEVKYDNSAYGYPEGFINGGTYFAEMKNPWDQTVWGRPSRFYAYGSGTVGFGYGSPAGKYQMNITKENKVTMNTWTSGFDWRLGFTAPKTDTYYIDLSAVTATAITDERVKFLIYTDAALNSNGSLKSEDAAFKVYDFYKDRTSVEYPCKNGLLEIKLNEGQKLYFECDVTGGESYKDALLGVNFTLNINTGKAVRTNKINNSISIKKGTSDVSRYDCESSLSEVQFSAVNGVSGANIGNTVRWYSTNPAVATVDQDGKVTPKANGFAKIVAYNDFTSDEAVVTVGDIIAPTSVEITDLVSSIDQYDRIKLGYKITAPTGATAINVSWSSSNKNVIEVTDKGYVTAKGLGTATVTLNVDGKTATATITVTEHVCDNTKATWAIIEKATCTEEGLQQLLCNKCFCVLDEKVVPAKGHTAKEEWITYPTWNKEGSMHVKCFVCGYEGVEARPVGIVKEAKILEQPTKKEYSTGETFDPSGMTVEVTYENYEHKTTVIDFTGVTFNYDFSKERNTTVTFTLAGVEHSVAVKVSDGDVLYGDVDNNGTINTTDTDLLMKYLSGYDVDIREINTDVEFDGTVDVGDAVLIYQYLAGQITSFEN